MNPEQLAHMADVTRRYGRFRPCGAGLGVLWGGVVLGTLGLLMVQWTRHAYTAALPTQTFWRFLRDTPLTPPAWLQLAALLAPFAGWIGIVAIQWWVDGQFGAVTTESDIACGPRLKGPRWMAPFMVMLMATLMAGVLVWDGQLAAVRGVAGIAAIGAWALLWGRRSRDQLTLLVMFAISVPSIYVLAATDTNAKFTAGNLVIFATYFTLMLCLLLQGVMRFANFVRVRADLMAMRAVEE